MLPRVTAISFVVAMFLFSGLSSTWATAAPPATVPGVEDDNAAHIAAATKVIESKQSTPAEVCQALRSRALFYSMTGEGDKAIVDVTRVIELPGAPADAVAGALTNRAMFYKQKEAPDKALADFGAAIDTKGVGADTLCSALEMRAELYTHRGEDDKAIADYSREIAIADLAQPRMGSALNLRADCYSRLGKLDKALADYQMAGSLPGLDKSSRTYAIRSGGDCFSRLDQYDKAITEYTKVIDMADAAPRSLALALVSRGDAYRSDADNNRAIVDYSKVLELKGLNASDIAPALLGRAIAFGNKGKDEKAMADYNRLVEMPAVTSDQLAWGLANRSAAYVDAENFEAALSDIDKALEKQIADVAPFALNCRANCFRKMGKNEKAIEATSRALEVKDADPMQIAYAHALSGICLDRMGSREKAAAQFTTAIAVCSSVIAAPETVPDAMADALQTRGYVEILAGSFDAALEDTRRALALRPHDFNAAANVGLILLRQGKFAEMRKAYEFAVPLHWPLGTFGAEDDVIELRDTYHGPPETAVVLGFFYITAGKRDKATAELRKYLRDHPDGPLAPWARDLLAAKGEK